MSNKNKVLKVWPETTIEHRALSVQLSLKSADGIVFCTGRDEKAAWARAEKWADIRAERAQ